MDLCLPTARIKGICHHSLPGASIFKGQGSELLIQYSKEAVEVFVNVFLFAQLATLVLLLTHPSWLGSMIGTHKVYTDNVACSRNHSVWLKGPYMDAIVESITKVYWTSVGYVENMVYLQSSKTKTLSTKKILPKQTYKTIPNVSNTPSG